MRTVRLRAGKEGRVQLCKTNARTRPDLILSALLIPPERERAHGRITPDLCFMGEDFPNLRD